MTAVTPGMVCAHHHLYSSLARGMPPPQVPVSDFAAILEHVWWRLDAALDLQMIRWSAMLGALEALEQGTTTIVDHHESPNAIEGSLDVIARACDEVGVRVICSYGVTDRHGADGAARGLAENRRFLETGRRGLVGVHAAFTCSDETLVAAAELAAEFDVGVNIHVAEGVVDRLAPYRLRELTNERWLLAHGVHLPTDHGLDGTILHTPRSDMINGVGYAGPLRFTNPVVLGTDGIGGDMVEEFRVAYATLRADDVRATPETPWDWLVAGNSLVPESEQDEVVWSHEPMDPSHVAYTSGIRPLTVSVQGRLALDELGPTLVDAGEIRAKAAEQAKRLHALL